MTSISALYDIYLQHPNVQTDTRLLETGSLFFALKGENFNGNDYAQQAIEQGAAYAIVDEPSLQGIEGMLLVEDVLTCLQQLALYHRKKLDIPFLAITGSNGKTTTKELLAAVLSTKYKVLATKGNLNNHIGVPLTLLNISKEHDFAIIEMGANHQKEIASYCEWVLPNYGLINNCGKAHLEGFGGIEGVRKGKGELYEFIKETKGSIFINTDYDYLNEMSADIDQKISYGEYSGDCRGKIYQNEPYLEIALLSKGSESILKTKLVGDYNLPNILASVCVGQYFQVGLENIQKAIENYRPDNNRSEHRIVNGTNIIMDAYNANPSSMRAAIDSFNKRSQRDKIMVLGAMMELGADSAKEHQSILDYALRHPFKKIVTVGALFGECKGNQDVEQFDNANEAKKWLWDNVQKTDWVYIKGSRLTALEKIIDI